MDASATRKLSEAPPGLARNIAIALTMPNPALHWATCLVSRVTGHVKTNCPDNSVTKWDDGTLIHRASKGDGDRHEARSFSGQRMSTLPRLL
jgi:hypothetical protein